MNQGVLLAVFAATTYGILDLGATYLSRRFGTGITLLCLTGGGLFTLAPLALLVGSGSALTGGEILRLVVIGAGSAVSSVLLIQALRLGPVSVVGPITSSVGAAVAAFAIALGERPTGPQIVAIVLAISGSALASIAPGSSLRSIRVAGPGVAMAAVFVVIAGVVILALRDITANDLGAPLVLLRLSTGIWLLIIGAVLRWRPPRPSQHPELRRWLAFGIGLGFMDGIATVALSGSFRWAPAWLIGLVIGLAPAIVTVGGVALFKEPLGRLQVAGIVLLILSLAALALGT